MTSPLDSNIHTASPVVIDEQNAPGMTLPKWFLMCITGIAGIFAVTYVPWSIWVTIAIFGMDDNTDRIKALELQIQTFNGARFESRLDRIEIGVQSLQRDFDRTLGKVKE